MPTPVEVWGPAFEKVLPGDLTPGRIFSEAGMRDGQRWCSLCETYVAFAQQGRHAKAHQREREQWKNGGRRAAERARRDEARQVERLRREEERVLGRAPSGVGRQRRSAVVRGGRPGEKGSGKVASTNAKKEPGKGQELFRALLDRVKSIGTVVEHKDGAYARVMVDDGKRNVGYVVPGVTKLNVYPQAEAKDMPKDLGFKRVALGSHHYGRGEVIVPVEGEDDFGTAEAALKAAAALPPRERKGAATKKTVAATKAGGNGGGKKAPAKKTAATGTKKEAAKEKAAAGKGKS